MCRSSLGTSWLSLKMSWFLFFLSSIVHTFNGEDDPLSGVVRTIQAGYPDHVHDCRSCALARSGWVDPFYTLV